MATFPSISPLYATQETVNQDNNVVKLGDGYQQRLVFGLPANKRLINLNLAFNISTTDADTITHAFIADASTSGNILFVGQLDNSKTIDDGDIFRINTNNLTIELK